MEKLGSLDMSDGPQLSVFFFTVLLKCNCHMIKSIHAIDESECTSGKPWL